MILDRPEESPGAATRAFIAIAVALATVLAAVHSASAVTDRNLTARGQMPPQVDTAHPVGHANAMMQGRYASAAGPTARTVVAFGEGVVKTLPLIPGASVLGAPGVLESGNLIVGSGRGLGFSSLSLHDPVTGAILWSTPPYLGSSDYINARTVGPGAYLQPQTLPLQDGNLYVSDGHNMFSFVAETGERNWFAPQSSLPPGPQREREEGARPQSLDDDVSVGLTAAPDGIRSPTGGWLVGGVFSRGSINYFDTSNGDAVIVKSAESANRTPSCLAEQAGSPVACPSFGFNTPSIYVIIGFLCHPGGQLSAEIKDWCSAFSFTRHFATNGTLVDPLRNRIAFTYAGSGGTLQDGSNTELFSKDFDVLKVWEFVTNNGAGQDGTILTGDSDGDGFGDAGIEEVWLAEVGLNTRSTPTLSDSFDILYGVDGAGTALAFDANAAQGQLLASASGVGPGASSSTDHNDSLVLCSSEQGIARLDPSAGDVIWQNFGDNLGLAYLPTVPDAPLQVSGRPLQDCVGVPSTHVDAHQAQFVVGYPALLLESLASFGIPLPSTLTRAATVDVQVDAATGETEQSGLRSFYAGTGEANIVTLDSGRFVSARTNRLSAINVGILNLLLPQRFRSPPGEGGFVISEPLSFRDSVLEQLEGAKLYCEQILNGVFIPDQNGDGQAESISEGLPILVSGTPAEQAAQARKLQLATNKVGYIDSILSDSLPGRMSNAASGAEITPPEAAAIGGNVDDALQAIRVARDLLLGDAANRNDPSTHPDLSTQQQARLEIESACGSVGKGIDVLVCGGAAACEGALFRSAQSGPWQAPSTWREGRVPTNGDWVEIAHSVTIPVGQSVIVGHSPGPADPVPAVRVVSNGRLTLEAGSSLVSRGDLKAAGTVTLRAGAQLQMDASRSASPANSVYVIEITPGSSSAHLRLEGTAAAHVRVGSNPAAAHTRITDGGVAGGGRVVADFADFQNLGGSPDYRAWAYWPSGSGDPFRLTDCSFTNSSQVKASVTVPAGGHVEFERVSFRNSLVKPDSELAPFEEWHIHETGSSPGANVTLRHCDFDQSVGLFFFEDLEMENNILRRGAVAHAYWGGAWKSFKNNFFRWDSDKTASISFPGGLTLEDNVFIVDPQDCDEPDRADICWNPHFMWLAVDGGASVLGNIWWWTGTDAFAEGDGVLLAGASSGDRADNIYRFERNIFMPNGNGPNAVHSLSATGFTVLGSTDNYQVHFSRNTLYSSGFGGCNIGETGITHAGDIGYFKSNLFVGGSGGSGRKIRNLGNSEPDSVLAADADWNASYRLSDGSNYGNGSGKGYEQLSFSGNDVIGANDLDDVDPSFVDPSRTPLTWDASLGGPGTMQGAMDRLSAGGGGTVQELILYLREGFRPQNEALRGAGDPLASPIASPDIGAVDLATGP